MNFGDWLLFSSIALVATLSPGPVILLVTSHSFSFGLRRSVATMLGNVSGLFLMSALSVAGLSAIILHSNAVFTLVKLLGAAYLVYLGIRLIRNGFGNSVDPAATGIGREQLPSYKRGYLAGPAGRTQQPQGDRLHHRPVPAVHRPVTGGVAAVRNPSSLSDLTLFGCKSADSDQLSLSNSSNRSTILLIR